MLTWKRLGVFLPLLMVVLCAIYNDWSKGLTKEECGVLSPHQYYNLKLLVEDIKLSSVTQMEHHVPLSRIFL